MSTNKLKSIARRIAKLETPYSLGLGRRRNHPFWQPRIQLRFGNLRTLPNDYRGERHIEVAGRLPDINGNQWVEFAEVPGPAPNQQSPHGSFPQGIDVIFVKPRRRSNL